ncbi:MAG: DUF2065 domain-containing protein [Thermodesulfobacteriota bacterium]
MTFLLSVIGVVLIIEGLPYFAFPVKVKEWSLSIREVPDRSLRLLGFLAMMAGLITVYFGKRYF